MGRRFATYTALTSLFGQKDNNWHCSLIDSSLAILPAVALATLVADISAAVTLAADIQVAAGIAAVVDILAAAATAPAVVVGIVEGDTATDTRARQANPTAAI